MLSSMYLEGLICEQIPNIPMVYALDHPHKSGSWYYISTYNYFKNNKERFFKTLGEMGQKEDASQWDLHHVVERQHLTSFVAPAMIDRLYESEWPCILINKQEHRAYNSILHSKESVIIFPLTGKSALSNLRELYKSTYDGNFVLQQIAANVLRSL